MRKLGGLILAIALAIPVPSGAAPIVKRQQHADAIWLVPTGEKGRFIGYYADAWLDEPNGGMFSWDMASIGKGRCTRRRTKNMVSTSCTFTAFASGKASEHFTMDPLLQTASLELEHKGETYSVVWEGGDAGFYSASEGCAQEGEEPKSGEGGGILRWATAEAHAFGEHLATKGRYAAMLRSGAMVTECSLGLADLRPGETRSVTF